MKNGIVYINDEASFYGSNENHDHTLVTVGDDEVYVLGDNINKSTDSRMGGCIPMKNIKGRLPATWYLR